MSFTNNPYFSKLKDDLAKEADEHRTIDLKGTNVFYDKSKQSLHIPNLPQREHLSEEVFQVVNQVEEFERNEK
jgi:hypothetical protein